MLHAHLIDDDPAIRAMLSRVLEGAGWRVTQSESGHRAVEDIARETPDVVLLDVTMPGPDGWTVLERLRSAGRDERVVMLTSRSTHDDVIRSRQAGADDFIAKPVRPDVLLERLGTLLERPQGDRDLLL